VDVAIHIPAACMGPKALGEGEEPPHATIEIRSRTKQAHLTILRPMAVLRMRESL
jgi:hypothetical protein